MCNPREGRCFDDLNAVQGGGVFTPYLTYATATPAITVTPTATVLAKDGATTSFAGVLADQFGRPIAAGNVFWSVAGRNPATGSAVTGTTGATGPTGATGATGPGADAIPVALFLGGM